MAEKAENQQKIKDLENDMKVLSDKEKETSNELERQEFETNISLDICLVTNSTLGLKLALFLLFQAERKSEENVQSNETRRGKEKDSAGNWWLLMVKKQK